MMPLKPNLKRKEPPFPSNSRNPKRAKVATARTILAQSSEKALSTSGELNVSAFVKAREFEIQSLERSITASRHGLATRAFQQVPRELRRRTASHNVKKVPKRLRARAAKEMKEDNTPTVNSKTRELSGKQRLRRDLAKRAAGIGARAKAKRVAKQKEAAEGGEASRVETTAGIPPRVKKNALAEAPASVSKFRKRQIHKAWLPTHLYHAKRAHITPPKEPLWRFAIPLSPTEKTYRLSHRAATSRGCIAWDTSYMSTVMIEGLEGSLLGLLRSLGVPEEQVSAKNGAKWRGGSRSWSGWLRERDNEKNWIADTLIMWCCQPRMLIREDPDPGAVLEKGKRKMLIRVHPSAFLQLWNELVKVAKMQRPPAVVADMRFEIGSIEITGPGATETLVGALHPFQSDADAQDPSTSSSTWPLLAAVTNPAALPRGAVLDFMVSDPRLRHPPRRVDMAKVSENELLALLSSWPVDNNNKPQALYDRESLFTASRLQSSQKSVNRRKGEALAGDYPAPLGTDPRIPILLFASRAEAAGGKQGSWTLLLPWKWVLPVWYSLMHHPLSSGGNPRFGGLSEKRQLSFEQGTPWFPGDHPGTQSGWTWELLQREKRKGEWEKRPKGKRIEWDSLDLGGGRKGEIGNGWSCDWEVLAANLPSPTVAPASKGTDDKPDPHQATTDLPKPPPPLYHMPLSLLSTPSSTNPSSALITISITLLQRGVPTTCARIYRLPTTDPSLRAQWLALAPTRPTQNPDRSLRRPRPPPNAPAHEKRAALAMELLGPRPGSDAAPSAAKASYPRVPGEEDLVGFVTTGNFNLGEGRGTGVGCVLWERVSGEAQAGGKDGAAGRGRIGGGLGGLCIVREAGLAVGRLARWTAV